MQENIKRNQEATGGLEKQGTPKIAASKYSLKSPPGHFEIVSSRERGGGTVRGISPGGQEYFVTDV